MMSFEIVLRPAKNMSIKNGKAIHMVDTITEGPTNSGLSKNFNGLLMTPRSSSTSLKIPFRDAPINLNMKATATGGMIHGINNIPAMNEAYAPFFPEKPLARITVGGVDLALGAAVEIECIAVRQAVGS